MAVKNAVFDYHSATAEAERIGDYYAAFGKAEHFRFDVWEGGHTVSDDDTGYEFMFSELG